MNSRIASRISNLEAQQPRPGADDAMQERLARAWARVAEHCPPDPDAAARRERMSQLRSDARRQGRQATLLERLLAARGVA